jgi:cyclic pyranopterin phosphate synthase
MPTNNNEWLEDTQVLSFDEIVRLTSIFVKLGIKEIRITGGEPLTKPGLENLICSISLIPRINSIGLTTNGLLLADKIKQLISVGLKSVNISLDSFKESRFKSMSGITGVQKVINSIHKANEAGLHDHDRSILVPLLDLNFFQLSRISIVNNIHTANAMLTLVR